VVIELLRKARALQPQKLFVLITAFATVETAVEALREGASDYIVKTVQFDELRLRVRRLLEHQVASRESALFRRPVESSVPDRSLLGESPAMHAVRTQVARTGPAVSNVLITGESGHRQGAGRPGDPRGESPARDNRSFQSTAEPSRTRSSKASSSGT